MKKLLLASCIAVVGLVWLPGQLLASESPHGRTYSETFNCETCHPEGSRAGDPNDLAPECVDCHVDNSPPPRDPYSDTNSIFAETHTNSIAAVTAHDLFTTECLDCHDPHYHNANPGSNDLVMLIGGRQGPPELETTLAIESITILAPDNPDGTNDWADPVTWGKKTGNNQRGLILVGANGFTYEVLNATNTTITISNGKLHILPRSANMFLKYGMFVKENVAGTNVVFTDRRTLANNEGDTNIDPTPNGICQVCHTKTKFWRNDGTVVVGAQDDTPLSHHSGWNCTAVCHRHENGFIPNQNMGE